MFSDLDWHLNASRGLSAIAEFLVILYFGSFVKYSHIVCDCVLFVQWSCLRALLSRFRPENCLIKLAIMHDQGRLIIDSAKLCTRKIESFLFMIIASEDEDESNYCTAGLLT